MRQSSEAFYAAEAGLNELLATWDSTRQAQVDSLAAGDSLVLSWRTLDSGARYRGKIYRWDDGSGQPLYELTVEGRGRGSRSGQRVLSLALTSEPAAGTGYSIGKCCKAAATVRGNVEIDDDFTGISGIDEVPAGAGWDSVCPDPGADKPGLVMDDTTQLLLEDEDVYLAGDPPLVQDTSINDNTFDQFGPDLTWGDLKDRADHVIDTEGSSWDLDEGDIYPRYTVDPLTGELLCDKSHAYNWGSNDPSDPCFNYFPIIVIDGEVALHDTYGQGIIVLEWDDATNIGSEYELEDNSEYAGIILGKGCVEIQHNAVFHGGLLTDGQYYNYDLCDPDDPLAMSDYTGLGAKVAWSQCAVDRAIVNSGLDDVAEVENPGPGGEPVPLELRAFMEVLR